jgi:hypothetical protein
MAAGLESSRGVILLPAFKTMAIRNAQTAVFS